MWGSSWSSWRRRFWNKLLGDMRDAKIGRQSMRPGVSNSVSTCLQAPLNFVAGSEGVHLLPDSTPMRTRLLDPINVYSMYES